MIDIYSSGLLYCSVCADKNQSIDDITTELNDINPTGISSKWKLSEDKTFASGESNPCQCEHDSNRMHYLFIC